MRFLDESGAALTYWPVSGLKANEESQIIVIGVELDGPTDAKLIVGQDERLAVMIRLHGTADPFIDLALNPISLVGLPAGITQYDIKLRASEDIEGAPRVALIPGAASQRPAAWRV